ncbi:MAG: NAD-dependent dehydratase, partial [Planctomycetes bacterium]|nr:NAD-dependent dehydratase [Planctomycetota bacterium]
LTELILERTGSRLEIQYEPGGVTFVKNRVGCPKKASAQLGFQSQVDLQEGIQRLIEWRRLHRAELETRRSQDPARAA